AMRPTPAHPVASCGAAPFADRVRTAIVSNTDLSMNGHFIDLRPLKVSPAFARMWVGNLLAGLGGQLTIVTVMLHVFDLTGSTFAVSMVAFAGLVPMIIAGLYGGMLGDAFDRRRVALISASGAFAATALLPALTWAHAATIWWLYALTMIIAAA